MFEGKKISILGDSMSTFNGSSNDVFANSTTLFNPYYYSDPFPLEKTYWKIIMEKLHLVLCVNNSWSGGTLSGRDYPDSGVNRANNLARDDGAVPEIVLVFMGLNDVGQNVDIEDFSMDYERTLMTIKERYSNAMVCCVNLPDRDSSIKKKTELFNASIDNAVKVAGDNFFIADLYHSHLNNDCYFRHTLDGLHLDDVGMRMLADVVIDAIKQNCGARGWPSN